MIGAMKCCGSGARMLRGVTPTLESSNFCNMFEDLKSVPYCQLNWSQTRFLRGQASTSNPGNVNSQFVVKEVENQGRNEITSTELEHKASSNSKSLSEFRHLRRSLRGHQSLLSTQLSSEEEPLAHVSKLVVEDGPATVRVKNRENENLLMEWLGIQKELRKIKNDRVEDDKRLLQIAGQQVLREMEDSLRKSMNLEDLDQAIEGALCSQAKTSHDN